MAMKRLMGDTTNVYEASIATGKAKSQTCKAIMEYLNDGSHSRPFDVILLDDSENFGQMLTESDQTSVDANNARGKFKNAFKEDKIGYPVVLWNPYYKFEYFGDVDGVKMNPSGDVVKKQYSELKSGDMYLQTVNSFGASQTPVVFMIEAEMPSWIVLFHELGHVKQYYESGGEADWKKKLGNVAAIEADNLKRHEYPICRNVNLPTRGHYKHNIHGFSTLLQKYSGLSIKEALIQAPNAAKLKEKKATLLQKAKQNGIRSRDLKPGDKKIPGFFVK